VGCFHFPDQTVNLLLTPLPQPATPVTCKYANISACEDVLQCDVKVSTLGKQLS